MTDFNLLSEKLLLAVKMAQPYKSLLFELSNWRDDIALGNDSEKLAFWINIYNSFYQIIATEYPEVSNSIFKEKRIEIANIILSLDDIEHGILRLGKFKYSFGFWKTIGSYRRLRKFRPSKFDFRIHFALNCGAKSCPPILQYTANNIDEQLDLASLSFLEAETSIHRTKKTVSVSKLFLWYYKDFGKKKGILIVLESYLNQSLKGYKIKFNNYDWTTSLGMFK